MDIEVYTEDICGDEKNLWFVDGTYNILYKIDLNTTKVSALIIPYKEEFGHVLYNRIMMINDEIWMVPQRAHRLVIYNTSMNDFKTIDFASERDDYEWLFNDCIYYNDYLYLMPHLYDKIVVVDVKTKTICGRVELSRLSLNNKRYGTKGIIKGEDGCYCMALVGGNDYLHFDCKKGSVDTLKLNIDDNASNIPYVCKMRDYNIVVNNNDIHSEILLLNSKMEVLKRHDLGKGWVKPYTIWDRYVVVEHCYESQYEVYDDELNLIYKSGKKEYNSIIHSYDGGIWANISQELVVHSDNVTNTIDIYKGNFDNKKSIELAVDRSILIEAISKYSCNKNTVMYENRIIDGKVFIENLL